MSTVVKAIKPDKGLVVAWSWGRGGMGSDCFGVMKIFCMR